MSNDLFSIGLSGLQAAQWGLTVTSQNISNATTPGYTVENPVFAESSGQYTGAGYMGSGVTTVTVQRAYSQYLTTQLNNAQATSSASTASYTMASQLNNLVGSPTAGIAAAITGYFSGLQNVSNNPGSVAVRQTAISDAQELANQINAAGQQYDQLRQSVNQQLTSSVSQINSYATQIAQLNSQILAAGSQGQPPNQLMDQRDLALSQLSQLAGVSVVRNNTGYTVSLSSGQPLVAGNQAFQLAAVTSPSNPSEVAISYTGAAGSPAPATPQYLSSSTLTGGSVGGLLSFVSQTLDPAAAQLGAIATSFASQVNAQNQLGLTLTGAAGGPLFSVAGPAVYANAGNTGTQSLTVTLANASQPPADNFSLSYSTVTGTGTYTLTDTTTGSVVGTSTTLAVGTPVTIGGLTLSVGGGAIQNGDSFTIQPTQGALDSFALATTDPTAIAAASPVLAHAATTNTGTGAITQGTVGAGYSIPNPPLTVTYNTAVPPALSGFPVGSTVTVGSGAPIAITAGPPVTTVPYTAGASITVNTPPPAAGPNAVTFTISGTPANGDSFTIGQNTGAASDGRNALAMSNLVSNPVLSNGTVTLTNAYANYVNNIGNATSQLQASSTSQTAVVTQITAAQQSVQGVNLNDEAANLMQYQQLYQANSKVIQTAETLFQTLIGVIQ
ncbi:flagellar hook-associated protein FlgK [Trinickia mobilis]|uniref:flagellar hook-associated protein FlgK n=1 Tax=Trinickia mobilis TaxID=2816356 RepID=UPI001A909051|nr:flagellar hook-associated protein FlgK [Trinickia mobilis]